MQLCQIHFCHEIARKKVARVKVDKENVRIFLLELYLAIDPSNLASKNGVTQLSEFEMHVQK